MAQETFDSADNTRTVPHRALSKWRLVQIVVLSFLAGMYFTFGLDHQATKSTEVRIFDFLLAAGWLTCAILAAQRFLKENQRVST